VGNAVGCLNHDELQTTMSMQGLFISCLAGMWTKAADFENMHMQQFYDVHRIKALIKQQSRNKGRSLQ